MRGVEALGFDAENDTTEAAPGAGPLVELLASAYETAPRAIALAALDGALLRCNPAFRALVGPAAELREGIALADLVAPEDRDALTALLAALPGTVRGTVRGTGADRATYELRRDPRGRGGRLQLTVTLVRRQGAATGFLVYAEDIAVRESEEAQVRLDRELAATVLENVASLVAVFDRGGRVVRFNQMCERTMGYAFAEVRGQRLWELALARERRPQAEGLFADLRPERFPYTAVGVWMTRAGVPRTISWTITALLDGGGAVQHIVATGADVTEQRRAEAAFAEVNAQLQGRVAEMQQAACDHAALNELNSMLQACVGPGEAYALLGQALPRLFAGASGSLSVFRASRNVVETMTAWGGAGGPHGEHGFGRDDCWSLRRGRTHVVDGARAALPCAHFADPAPASALCIPMMARGETLGVLHLGSATPGPMPQGRLWLAQTVAGQCELLLANLQLQETLRNQSIRDGLSGIFNRRYLEETLEREVRRAGRHGQPVGVIMLDVDHFKRFNDSFGHDAGDALLREVGRTLLEWVRVEDIPCRYGGEEFVAVLPGASVEVVAERAERLREAIAALRVDLHGRALGTITASLGVASWPDHGATGAAVVTAADAALYRAKHEGRDRVVVSG